MSDFIFFPLNYSAGDLDMESAHTKAFLLLQVGPPPILILLPLRYPILSYPFTPYPILSYPILSYHILSYPILSYPILSYPILPYPTLATSEYKLSPFDTDGDHTDIPYPSIFSNSILFTLCRYSLTPHPITSSLFVIISSISLIHTQFLFRLIFSARNCQ